LSDAVFALPECSPYVLIFLCLTVGIWLVPFAEEIALATAGYWYYSGAVELTPILGVTVAGVFLGDAVAFWVGRRWSGTRFHRSLSLLGDSRWRAVVWTFVDRYGSRALFGARFLPGVRLPAHVLAGMRGMSVATYSRVSLLSVVVYVPAVFWVACCQDFAQ
jgi:membrane protein DedA with SNARE-associated domain